MEDCTLSVGVEFFSSSLPLSSQAGASVRSNGSVEKTLSEPSTIYSESSAQRV